MEMWATVWAKASANQLPLNLIPIKSIFFLWISSQNTQKLFFLIYSGFGFGRPKWESYFHAFSRKFAQFCKWIYCQYWNNLWKRSGADRKCDWSYNFLCSRISKSFTCKSTLSSSFDFVFSNIFFYEDTNVWSSDLE